MFLIRPPDVPLISRAAAAIALICELTDSVDSSMLLSATPD